MGSEPAASLRRSSLLRSEVLHRALEPDTSGGDTSCSRRRRVTLSSTPFCASRQFPRPRGDDPGSTEGVAGAQIRVTGGEFQRHLGRVQARVRRRRTGNSDAPGLDDRRVRGTPSGPDLGHLTVSGEPPLRHRHLLDPRWRGRRPALRPARPHAPDRRDDGIPPCPVHIPRLRALRSTRPSSGKVTAYGLMLRGYQAGVQAGRKAYASRAS